MGSNRTYSYSILTSITNTPSEQTLVFVLNEQGYTKAIKRKYWTAAIRLVNTDIVSRTDTTFHHPLSSPTVGTLPTSYGDYSKVAHHPPSGRTPKKIMEIMSQDSTPPLPSQFPPQLNMNTMCHEIKHTTIAQPILCQEIEEQNVYPPMREIVFDCSCLEDDCSIISCDSD